jgi:hypothetical protein
MAWLGEHLHLRRAVNASQQIRRHRCQPPALARKLKNWMAPDPRVTMVVICLLDEAGARESITIWHE